MAPDAFALVKDGRGSLVHVRNRRSGECIGCIEVGLFEVVRRLLLGDAKTPAESGRREAGR